MIPHLIVFINPNFKGKHMHIFDSYKELPGEFNNAISSFVVLSGRWRMYDGTGFENPIGDSFTAGMFSLDKTLNLNRLKAKISKSNHLEEEEKKQFLENLNLEEKIEKVERNDVISSIELEGMW